MAATVASSDGRMAPTRCSRSGVSDGFFVLSHSGGYVNCAPRIRGGVREAGRQLARRRVPPAARPTSAYLPFCSPGVSVSASQSRTPGSGNQKPAGHDADDGARPAAQDAASCRRSPGSRAELAPEAVAQDDDALGAGRVLARAEPAAEAGLSSEHVEELRRRGDGGDEPRGAARHGAVTSSGWKAATPANPGHWPRRASTSLAYQSPSLQKIASSRSAG